MDREQPPSEDLGLRWLAQLRRGSRAPAYAQLLQDVVDVVLHRRHLDGQRPRDLSIGETSIDQRDDLPFPSREAAGGAALRSSAGDVTEEDGRDLPRAGNFA